MASLIDGQIKFAILASSLACLKHYAAITASNSSMVHELTTGNQVAMIFMKGSKMLANYEAEFIEEAFYQQDTGTISASSITRGLGWLCNWTNRRRRLVCYSCNKPGSYARDCKRQSSCARNRLLPKNFIY